MAEVVRLSLRVESARETLALGVVSTEIAFMLVADGGVASLSHSLVLVCFPIFHLHPPPPRTTPFIHC